MSRRAFKSRGAHRSDQPGELIHSNVGSYEVSSRKGYKYFITFINDCSKFLQVYPMKFENDAFNCFKLFRASFEKSGAYNIKSLQTDNGGEYLSNEFSAYLGSAGIKHKPGPPHSPELNGVAERANRTIGNLIRCLLLHANTPLQKGLYWLQPPAVTLARGNQCYIGHPDRFYVGRAHRYIRTKA
jgi:transposase InsO family protein